MAELDELKGAVDALEAQRHALGAAAVDAALAGLRERLAALEQQPRRPPAEGERKQVTVMFGDLSGFTSLAETTDAEDVRNLVNACFERVGEVVARYGGYIDKFIGDELMVLFGAPVAMEDHAARSLYAALEIRDAIAGIGERYPRLREHELNLHVGINSGLVVAGAIGTAAKRDYTVMGDPVNVAARLVARAAPGEILIGASTRRLAAGLFDFEDVGAIGLKGRVQQQEVFRLLRVRSRAEIVGSIRRQSKMIGRDQELQRMQELFRVVVEQRQPRSVAVVGPPGIGKSRLQREFRQWLVANYPDAEVLRGSALPHMAATPYFIIGELLRNWVGLTEADSAGEARRRLESALAEIGIPDLEAVHALAAIIGIEYEDDRLKELTPEERRKLILSAYVLFVNRVAAQRPALLVFEDLHWADDLSLDLLEHLSGQIDAVPALFLTLTRPIPDPQARARRLESHLGEDIHVSLLLRELPSESSAELVTALVPGLSAEIAGAIVTKGQGNPFFHRRDHRHAQRPGCADSPR